MRIAARKDRNQDEIVKALRGAGAYVKPINHEGLFDLLVWHRGETFFLEVKDGDKPPSARKLTEAEQKFHDEWPGDNLFVVCSIDEALYIVTNQQ
jgi:hypothetical protein